MHSEPVVNQSFRIPFDALRFSVVVQMWLHVAIIQVDFVAPNISAR
jgi:hypothetical protein